MLDKKTLIAYINGLVLFQANTADCPEAKSIEISSEGFVYTAISKKRLTSGNTVTARNFEYNDHQF